MKNCGFFLCFRVTQGNLNIGQEVGYCPQEDALDGRLTGREMLHCYAKLRGLPAKSRNYVSYSNEF